MKGKFEWLISIGLAFFLCVLFVSLIWFEMKDFNIVAGLWEAYIAWFVVLIPLMRMVVFFIEMSTIEPESEKELEEKEKMNRRTVLYSELSNEQKENFKNMVVELTCHNGISRDNLIALIKDMAQENAELKAELKAERDLQALIWTEKNNNEYYKAYVKDWQERKGKNATIPHADEVYKDYVELKARLEKSETTLFVVVRNNTPKLIEGEAAKMGFDKIAVRTIQKMEDMIDYPSATKARLEAEKALKEKGE